MNKKTVRTILTRAIIVVGLALMVSFAVMSVFSTAVADYKDGTIIAAGIAVFVVASASLTLYLHNLLNPYWRRAQRRKKTERKYGTSKYDHSDPDWNRKFTQQCRQAYIAAANQPIAHGSAYDFRKNFDGEA